MTAPIRTMFFLAALFAAMSPASGEPEVKAEYYLLENRMFDAKGELVDAFTSIAHETTLKDGNMLVYREFAVGKRTMFPTDYTMKFYYDGSNRMVLLDKQGKVVTQDTFESRDNFWAWKFELPTGKVKKIWGHDLMFDQSIGSYFANIELRNGKRLTKQGRVIKISKETFDALMKARVR